MADEALKSAPSSGTILPSPNLMDPDAMKAAPGTLLKTGPKSDPDYDYASAAAAGLKPDARGHLSDQYKLPNHITFSDDSIYADKGAGQWRRQGNGKWAFTPGATNLQHHSMDELRDYFKKHEPDAILVEPK
jgi:hypothetical protein